jgi:Flp pilus assembly protein TadG
MPLVWKASASLSRACARRRRVRRERGAVALEAAILTPLMFLLFFGIVEFGMLYKDYLAVTSSVRAGARMASAEPRVATFGADAAAQVAKEASALDMNKVNELWIYKATASGYPVGSNGTSFNSCTSCIKYHWDSGTKTFVAYSTSWTALQQNACSGPTEGPPDSIGVYMKFTYQGVTGLIFNEMPLEEHTVMSLEPLPTTKICK